MTYSETELQKISELIQSGDVVGLKKEVGADLETVVCEEYDGLKLIDDVMVVACYEWDIGPLRTLLRAGLPADFESCDGDGVTLLMRASFSNLDTVRCLLEAGANPNTEDSKGWAPLMFAVATDVAACGEEETAEIVKCLLAAGARKDHRNAKGHTAYDIAKMQTYEINDLKRQIAEDVKPQP